MLLLYIVAILYNVYVNLCEKFQKAVFSEKDISSVSFCLSCNVPSEQNKKSEAVLSLWVIGIPIVNLIF